MASPKPLPLKGLLPWYVSRGSTYSFCSVLSIFWNQDIAVLLIPCFRFCGGLWDEEAGVEERMIWWTVQRSTEERGDSAEKGKNKMQNSGEEQSLVSQDNGLSISDTEVRSSLPLFTCSSISSLYSFFLFHSLAKLPCSHLFAQIVF